MVGRSVARALVVVAAVVAVGAATTRVAVACSFACIKTQVRPSTMTVPANAPAIVVYVFQKEFHLKLDQVFAALLLRDERGNVVPVTYEAQESVNYQLPVLLRPTAPLAEGGKYYVDYALDCDGTSALAPVMTRSNAPLPTTAGTVSVGASVREERNIGSSAASCTSPVEITSATLTFTPSSDVSLFMPLTRIATTVDGQPWAGSRYGETASAYGPFQKTPLVFHSTCGQTKGAYDGTDPGLAAGHHTGELTVEVAGMDPLPGLPFEFDLECPKSGCDVADGGSSTAALGFVALALLVVRRRRWVIDR